MNEQKAVSANPIHSSHGPTGPIASCIIVPRSSNVATRKPAGRTTSAATIQIARFTTMTATTPLARSIRCIRRKPGPLQPLSLMNSGYMRLPAEPPTAPMIAAATSSVVKTPVSGGCENASPETISPGSGRAATAA